jgi:hypothetical protein
VRNAGLGGLHDSSTEFDCSARWRSLRADRAWKPPTSSSLADKERVGSFLLSTAARDPGLIASLADLAVLQKVVEGDTEIAGANVVRDPFWKERSAVRRAIGI